MSKKQEATAAAEPFISEYDAYAGTYSVEPLGVNTDAGFFPVDRAPLWLIDGQKVLIAGRCEYASVEESQDCQRVPTRMTITNVTPL